VGRVRFPEFFEQLPDRTRFFDLKGSWVDGLLKAHPQYGPFFVEREERYFLRPETFDFDFNNHIRTFSPDKRQGFLYDLRKIRERNPVLHWSDEDESDLFAELAYRNFGADSDYAGDSGRRELGRVIAELRRTGRLRTLAIEIDGSKEAVSMSLGAVRCQQPGPQEPRQAAQRRDHSEGLSLRGIRNQLHDGDAVEGRLGHGERNLPHDAQTPVGTTGVSTNAQPGIQCQFALRP
jgi:hypothetical protein